MSVISFCMDTASAMASRDDTRAVQLPQGPVHIEDMFLQDSQVRPISNNNSKTSAAAGRGDGMFYFSFLGISKYLLCEFTEGGDTTIEKGTAIMNSLCE